MLSGREHSFEKVLITNRFSVSIDIKIISVLSNSSLLIFGSLLKNIQGDVPKWLKGPLSKSGRGLISLREFESLHLRHSPQEDCSLVGFFF